MIQHIYNIFFVNFCNKKFRVQWTLYVKELRRIENWNMRPCTNVLNRIIQSVSLQRSTRAYQRNIWKGVQELLIFDVTQSVKKHFFAKCLTVDVVYATYALFAVDAISEKLYAYALNNSQWSLSKLLIPKYERFSIRKDRSLKWKNVKW